MWSTTDTENGVMRRGSFPTQSGCQELLGFSLRGLDTCTKHPNGLSLAWAEARFEPPFTACRPAHVSRSASTGALSRPSNAHVGGMTLEQGHVEQESLSTISFAGGSSPIPSSPRSSIGHTSPTALASFDETTRKNFPESGNRFARDDSSRCVGADRARCDRCSRRVPSNLRRWLAPSSKGTAFEFCQERGPTLDTKDIWEGLARADRIQKTQRNRENYVAMNVRAQRHVSRRRLGTRV